MANTDKDTPTPSSDKSATLVPVPNAPHLRTENISNSDLMDELHKLSQALIKEGHFIGAAAIRIVREMITIKEKTPVPQDSQLPSKEAGKTKA